jgi:hypothetical protein
MQTPVTRSCEYWPIVGTLSSEMRRELLRLIAQAASYLLTAQANPIPYDASLARRLGLQPYHLWFLLGGT